MELQPDNTRFEALVLELMENKDYPKFEAYVARKKRREERKKFMDGMTVPEFLELYEEPEKVSLFTVKLYQCFTLYNES